MNKPELNPYESTRMSTALPAAPTVVDKKQTSPIGDKQQQRKLTPDGFDLAQLKADNEEHAQETAYYANRGDIMLRGIVSEDRKPTYDELMFFKRWLGWDEMESNRQVRRMYSVMRLQSVVGTSAQREAAAIEKTKSAEILATEGPKLDDKIQKLMEQKTALERAASQSEKRCEQIQVACDELQKLELLRTDLFATYNGRKQEFGQSVWSEMNALGVEIQFRETLLSSEVDYRLIDHIRSNFRECIETCEHTRQPKIIGSAWEAKKRVLQQELDEMRPKFEALRVIREQQEAQLNELKTHYLKENG